MSPPILSETGLLEAGQSIIVDTDVVSYLFKGDTRAGRYLPHLAHRAAVVSFMTAAELDLWAEVGQWGPRNRELLRQFLQSYAVHFPDRRLCNLWALITADARRAGRPIQTADAWIAATALLYDVPLVTHNPADYAGVPGLTLITEAAP